MIVAPGPATVVPLAPEFVCPQDGQDQQDCELAAARRWLERWGGRYAPWGMTLLGDDLYSHQPFCQEVRRHGFHFRFVCRPDSHPTRYEWVADFARLGHVRTVIKTRWTGKERLIDTYRYMHQVPLRDSDDALLVNWCELTTTTTTGNVVYTNAWVTSHPMADDPVVALVAAGRSRWKIENENHHVLKTNGYHFEHNYGHRPAPSRGLAGYDARVGLLVPYRAGLDGRALPGGAGDSAVAADLLRTSPRPAPVPTL